MAFESPFEKGGTRGICLGTPWENPPSPPFRKGGESYLRISSKSNHACRDWMVENNRRLISTRSKRSRPVRLLKPSQIIQGGSRLSSPAHLGIHVARYHHSIVIAPKVPRHAY